ncbi:MAG: precorrin-6y C5,15-methyltransferase (decarboxylating) subunit CbiE [Desulfovibrionales bacterium]|nr:precorrin-6y C5,15-methyltransferase (decarboxylating) subunit CbiE [Desulfovibrionales bacterium]
MIHVIGLGVGPADPPPDAMSLIRGSAMVAGGTRILDRLGIEERRRICFTRADEFAAHIRAHAAWGDVCVVADGDPLLFGIGTTLLRFFPAQDLNFRPNVSAMQAACARFGLPWAHCVPLSMHGRSDLAPLFAALARGSLVAVYTDPEHDPGRLAQALMERGVQGWRMHVAEALGLPEERLSSLDLDRAAAQSWHPLNLVLFERMSPPPLDLCLGLDDSLLAHDQELITKQPVRALALSLLRLAPDSTLWDLGAGSGAVSLEAARLVPYGRIIAVERHPSRLQHIRENILRTGAWLVEPVCADVGEFLARESSQTTMTPSSPTRIFLGGGATHHTLSRCCDLLHPGGYMVVSAVLLSTLVMTRSLLSERGWPCTIHQIAHNKSVPLGKDLRFVPSNPVFLVETHKHQAMHE